MPNNNGSRKLRIGSISKVVKVEIRFILRDQFGHPKLITQRISRWWMDVSLSQKIKKIEREREISFAIHLCIIK